MSNQNFPFPAPAGTNAPIPPASPYPYPHPHQHPHPMPPKKPRTGLWVALAIAAMVIVGGVVVVGFMVLNKIKAPNSTAAKNTTIVVPDQLGGRPKNTDPKLQSSMSRMSSGLQWTGETTAVSAIYGSMIENNFATFLGATTPHAEKVFDTYFTKLGSQDTGASPTQKIDAGPLGGKAQCLTTTSMDISSTVCAWVDQGSFGTVTWHGRELSNDLKAEFLAFRSQAEQKK